MLEEVIQTGGVASQQVYECRSGDKGKNYQGHTVENQVQGVYFPDGAGFGGLFHHGLNPGENLAAAPAGQEHFAYMPAPDGVLHQFVEYELRGIGVLAQIPEVGSDCIADVPEYIAVVLHAAVNEVHAAVNEVHYRVELGVEYPVEEVFLGPEVIVDQCLVAPGVPCDVGSGGCAEAFLQEQFLCGGQYLLLGVGCRIAHSLDGFIPAGRV